MKKVLSLIYLSLFISFFASNVFAKSYKIACYEDFFPYISVAENGELEGIIVDWWKLWSIKTGVEVEFVALDIQSSISKTKSGEIDIIAGLFYSDERAVHVDFSEPLMRMKTIILLKNSIVVDSVKNIKNKIGLIENNLAQLYLHEHYPQIELDVYKSHSSFIEEIVKQNLDGFTYDVPNPIGKYKEWSPPKGYYKFETLFAERLRPAVKKGNSELLNLIISGSSKITDEELTVIVQKWELIKKDRSLLWLILIIGLILIATIVFLLLNSLKNKKKANFLADLESNTDWQVIIDKGENDLIEFKSSLRWDYRQEKVNKALEAVITKTISAFLNSVGGMLFIGVDDDGNVLGLDNDYNTMSKKNRDGFLLTLTNLINQNLGKSTHKFISINIISINDKDVCIVSVEGSDKPIFFGKSDNDEFYIRASASSQPLGLRESYKYINSHWAK